MIDVDKCEYEESFHNETTGCDTHYFIYPKALGECLFLSEKHYGKVCFMCISLRVYEDGECALAISPTVDTGDSYVDVEWRDMYEHINFTADMIPRLLAKTKKVF